jgi:hypothetical protein
MMFMISLILRGGWILRDGWVFIDNVIFLGYQSTSQDV